MVELMDNQITARTVNRKVATLRKYFKFLLQSDLITGNPAAQRSSPPKHPKSCP
jgi:integrase/recombinase XerC